MAEREFVNESDLERKVLYCLLADRTIRRVRDQWPAVPYQADGRSGTHVFDFWFERFSGERVAVAVRPTKRMGGPSRGGPSLPAIVGGIEARDLARFADRAMIVTESDVAGGAVYNARKILRARRNRNEDDVREVLDVIRPLRGAVRFHDLVRGAKVPATRRIALWCLIDDGILVAADDGPIDDACRMLVNRDLTQIPRRAA